MGGEGRGERGGKREKEGERGGEREKELLGVNIPSTVQSHLRTNHTLFQVTHTQGPHPQDEQRSPHYKQNKKTKTKILSQFRTQHSLNNELTSERH